MSFSLIYWLSKEKIYKEIIIGLKGQFYLYINDKKRALHNKLSNENDLVRNNFCLSIDEWLKGLKPEMGKIT